ncbi:hypothetical protein [Massilia sp. Root418]|jgi:hypothetical protein|uniref:hypothetical protein n=1 Tax=Massilia sp. Root418 TaxID=1736532 RepID=UPI0012F6AAF3|nr:hypothetical protein [Massilia sp. Root418]
MIHTTTIVSRNNMSHVKQECSFASVCKIFSGEKPAQKPLTEMRQLSDDELRAVAGGPEFEVGNGQ